MVRRALLGLVVLCAFLLATTLADAGGMRLNSREAALLREINRVRADRGLKPLSLDSALERAARSHSGYMLRTDSFDHGDFAGRLARFQVRASYAGENLAWGNADLGTPQGLVAGWLASPPHRENLLGPAYRRVGVGAVVGPFLGYPGATVVTADFAG
jgi:uncharacterized protein YkwD